MSIRTSIFREVTPGVFYAVFYGVYQHHDGYTKCDGKELLEAIKDDYAVEHMSNLYDKYEQEYDTYSYDDIMKLWKNKGHNWGYIVYLNGDIKVYSIVFNHELVNNDIKYEGNLEKVFLNKY